MNMTIAHDHEIEMVVTQNCRSGRISHSVFEYTHCPCGKARGGQKLAEFFTSDSEAMARNFIQNFPTKFLVIVLMCVAFARADEFQRHEDAQDQVEATRQLSATMYDTASQVKPYHVQVNGEDCHFGKLSGDDDKQKTIVTEDHKRHTLWYLNCPSDPAAR